MATKVKVPEIIQRSITKRLKRIEDRDELDRQNLETLLKLYQLKAWVKGDN